MYSSARFFRFEVLGFEQVDEEFYKVYFRDVEIGCVRRGSASLPAGSRHAMSGCSKSISDKPVIHPHEIERIGKHKTQGTYLASVSALEVWHSLRELVSWPEVWLAQCLCKSNESLPYRKLVESAKAEQQRIRIRTSQSASIDGENLNTLGRRQLFRLS